MTLPSQIVTRGKNKAQVVVITGLLLSHAHKICLPIKEIYRYDKKFDCRCDELHLFLSMGWYS